MLVFLSVMVIFRIIDMNNFDFVDFNNFIKFI